MARFFCAWRNVMSTLFISTAIPYVNASLHIGFALELVVADVIARHARQAGSRCHFLSGTDDNSLKNALAAEQSGLSTAAFVNARASEFRQLRETLNISYDDFLSTSTDPRHAPAVEVLWRRCQESGDIYESEYEGLYCVGCEQFYAPAELHEGVCPEHRTKPASVHERNYFFRLSRYQDELVRLIENDEISILPAHRKNEVLAFLSEPLLDLSISRSVARARGWGIPVPDDPTQIIYVWFDALAYYISSPGFARNDEQFRRLWDRADRIAHVIGKGVTRFHAVYWPAILLSAGVRVPSQILVHGYVTIDGQKISKSLGNAISPHEARDRLGTDALRYYLLRHVGSQRDGDFSWARFDEVHTHDLANDLGNLVSRTTALGRRHGVPPLPAASALAEGLAAEVARHVEEYALDRALGSIWTVIEQTNAYINQTAPWSLAKRGNYGELADVLTELYGTLDCVGRSLAPFLPATSERLLSALSASSAVQLFPKTRA
jgi:methionyl-tRNA synthetase